MFGYLSILGDNSRDISVFGPGFQKLGVSHPNIIFGLTHYIIYMRLSNKWKIDENLQNLEKK